MDDDIRGEHMLQALALVAAAASCLGGDEPERAAWRLADALGLISRYVPPETVGIGTLTGRGYALKVATSGGSGISVLRRKGDADNV